MIDSLFYDNSKSCGGYVFVFDTVGGTIELPRQRCFEVDAGLRH